MNFIPSLLIFKIWLYYFFFHSYVVFLLLCFIKLAEKFLQGKNTDLLLFWKEEKAFLWLMETVFPHSPSASWTRWYGLMFQQNILYSAYDAIISLADKSQQSWLNVEHNRWSTDCCLQLPGLWSGFVVTEQQNKVLSLRIYL